MHPLVIVKTGSTFPEMDRRFGDFDQWFIQGLDADLTPVTVVSPFRGQRLPAVDRLAGVIVTGSHNMVTERLAWSETTAVWLRQVVARPVPVLGVCYGHQLLAHALGGLVDDNPAGMEMGSVTIRLTAGAPSDPLLTGLPPAFGVQASHTQSVLRLPEGAVPLAASSMDPHHIFSWGPCAWGLQFHPEFDADVMRAYIHFMAADLSAAGQDVDQLLDGVTDTPESAGLLARFQKLCLQA